MDDIFEHLGKRYSGLGIYIDLKEAFDAVDHSILLHKLYNYGIHSIVYDFLKAIFLTDCSILQCSILLLIMQL